MWRFYLFFLCAFFLFFETRAQFAGKPAGIIRIQIPEYSQRLSSMPFVPFNSSIDNIFKGQLKGEASDIADRVVKWDNLTQSYLIAYKCDKTGDPGKDGKWFFSGTSDPCNMTLAPGEAFWMQNQHSGTQTVFLCGQVVMDDAISLAVRPGMNLVSYPFTSKIKLNSSKLYECGAYGTEKQDGGSDVFNRVSPDADFWLCSKPGSPDNGKWLDLGNIPASEELISGMGYWYNRRNAADFSWTENRPYANPFVSTAGVTPEITAITVNPDANAVTLAISCSGVSGETIEIFFQDIGEDDSFITDSGWQLLAEGISSNGSNSVSWTDDGKTFPVSFMRVYLVCRQDWDMDGDGISDGREKFIYGTDPASADTDEDGLTDAEEINILGSDPNSANSNKNALADTEETIREKDMTPGFSENNRDDLSSYVEMDSYYDSSDSAENNEIILHDTVSDENDFMDYDKIDMNENEY